MDIIGKLSHAVVLFDLTNDECSCEEHLALPLPKLGFYPISTYRRSIAGMRNSGDSDATKDLEGFGQELMISAGWETHYAARTTRKRGFYKGIIGGSSLPSYSRMFEERPESLAYMKEHRTHLQ